MTRNQYMKTRRDAKESRMVEHEERRWNEMTDDQLYSRLFKMRNFEKIRMFVRKAVIEGNAFLASAGRQHMRNLRTQG